MKLAQSVTTVIKKNLIDWIGKLVFAAIIGVVISMYAPAKDALMLRWNYFVTLDKRLQKIEDSVSNWETTERVIRADIAALKNNNNVFDISTFLSRPVKGYCTLSMPCTLRLYVRRVPGSESCRIIGDRSEHWVSSLIDGVARRVPSVNRGPAINVGLDWTPVEITILIPETIPDGAANYLLVAYYAYCDDQPDIVKDESLPIAVDIRSD